jgi:hypothetical protein
MSASAVRILVVGHTSPSTLATLQRLEKEGWRSHCVNTIVEAEGALKMIRFDVVLAEENIGGGRGYDLTDSVLELGGTLLVSIALSEASLWLPVVQSGMLTLGERALNSSMLQWEVREALTAHSGTQTSAAGRKMRDLTADAATRLPISSPDRRTGPRERRGQSELEALYPKRFLPPRRKPAADAAISMPVDASLKRESAKAGAVPRGGVPGRHFR